VCGVSFSRVYPWKYQFTKFRFCSRSPSQSCKPLSFVRKITRLVPIFVLMRSTDPCASRADSCNTFPIHHQLRLAFPHWIHVSECCTLPSKTAPVSRKLFTYFFFWRGIGTLENFYLKFRYFVATVLSASRYLNQSSNCRCVAGTSLLITPGKCRLTLTHIKNNKFVTID
jgi:hypothetical protein